MARSKSTKRDATVEANIDPSHVQDLSVPRFYATSIQIIPSGNNFSVMFSDQRPVVITEGLHKGGIAGRLSPVFVVDLSPQTAKDLHLLMSNQIESYEKEWGEINTPFKRKIEAPKVRGRAEKARNGRKR